MQRVLVEALAHRLARHQAVHANGLGRRFGAVNHYDVIEKDGEKYLCITDLKSERKWVDCALNDFLKNKEFKLPSFAASAL